MEIWDAMRPLGTKNAGRRKAIFRRIYSIPELCRDLLTGRMAKVWICLLYTSIPGRNVLFDGTNYVHCETFGDGVRDLAFKAAMNRGADQYKRLTLDSCLTADEIIPMYRIITGACSQGTKKFVDSLGTLKDSYTIREVIDITSGQYGTGTFKAFFNQE